MDEKTKSEKIPYQLGLPPMELAETNDRDNNSGTKSCILRPLIQKITAVIFIISFVVGAYIILISLLQGFDCGYLCSTEIVIVNQDRPNVTIQTENMEVFVQFKNKTQDKLKRLKREVSEEISESNLDNVFENVDDEKIQKSREIVMEHDVSCDNNNQEEICKNLVTRIKYITDMDENNKKENLDDLATNAQLKTIEEEVESIAQTDEAFTVKRETKPLGGLELLKPTPNVPFEPKDSYGYASEAIPAPVLPAPILPAPLIPGPAIPYTFVHEASPIADTCLLAKILKQHYPHAFHDISGYSPPHYEGHPLPYSRFVHPNIPTPLFQSRVADPHRKILHHQDAEIFMNFLTPQPTERSANSSAREAECTVGSVSCANGEGCILETQWCDGNVDCSDVSDESRCSCRSRVDKSRLCDGYFDCPFGEDEMGCYGCSESTFSCIDLEMGSQTTCFTKEQRCNNVADCPNRRDELDCTMLTPTLHTTALFAVSNTEGFLHRNFKGDWYAVCQNPYMWAHEACRKETGLIIRPPYIQVIPIDPMLKVNYLNTAEGGMIQMSSTCLNNSAIYVTCPDLLCGTRIMPTSQILRENAEVENHLFGRNKRFLLNKEKTDNSLNLDKGLETNNNLRNKRTESRVVGGRPSLPAAWPWMIAMYRDGMFHCGGVILSQSWVMSAAHCVSNFWEHYYEIRAGMLRRFSFSPQESNHRVTHVIVNQFYSKEDMKNDISLLKVEPEIQFSRWVRPICLPGLETAGADWKWGPPVGTMCTAVGWGSTVEHGPDPDHMREVEVPIWAHCKHREDRAGKEMCAGVNEGGKDACQGDSGGPLLCRNSHNPKQWYMAGIVSHGDGCGRKGEPGVYTRVSLFVKWIRYHMFSASLPSLRPKQECPGFRCISGMAKCLPSKRVCDKLIDCLGGEDETNCSSMKSQINNNNLFLNTPQVDPIETLLDNIQAKDAGLKNDTTVTDTNKNSHELTTTTVKISRSAEENESGTINENEKNTQNETSKEVSDSKSSEIDFTKESTQDWLDDNKNIFKDRETVEPISTTNEEIQRNSRDDLGDSENSITISVTKDSLQSMESLVKDSNTRDADIQEDWNDETSTFSAVSDVNLITTTNKPPKTNVPFVVDEEITQTSTTLEPPNEEETTAHDGSAEPESKDLLIDLPDPKPTQNSEIQNVSTHHDDEANAKILLKNSSNLIPAKLKKQHHPPKDFLCRHLPQVIPYNLRCDRKADCEDGTDELGCTCADYLIVFDQKLLCDGIYDCSNGEDEMDCYSCPEDHFLCKKSHQCISTEYVCDEKADCPLGEDELECFALTNGQNIEFDLDGTPKMNLQGFITKKHNKDWHVVCDENITQEQQELAAGHLCRYLGFSSANRYFVKYINVKDELLKLSTDEDTRSRRNIEDNVPVHFAFRKSDDAARHIVIKEPQILKEQCVPNVTKTCMSLYVYCDHTLFTENFDISNEILFRREATDEVQPHTPWPSVAKVFVDGDYRCSGVLVDLSWALVSHSCLWDTLLSHHQVTVVLGSHRTIPSSSGMYEQVYKVDTKKDLYHTKAVLLHLKEPAHYSTMVRPMVVSSNLQDEKSTVCVAIGQDETNTTVPMFVQETKENCNLHNRCFVKIQKENICAPGVVSHKQWAGIISCHTEQGWYPAASFVDSRGECGIGNRIVGSEIGSLKNEIKSFSGRTASDSGEMNAASDCDGVRCSRGRCIKLAQVCDGVPHCEDQNDEMEDACKMKTALCTKEPYQRGCECSSGQLKCHNGKCVAKEHFKDGRDDCGDASDEPEQMSCARYLARVKPSRLCDGILHCKDRSDEDPMYCKCFAKSGYRCKASSDVELCVSHDVVCDGINDCPDGEDERTCLALTAPTGSPYGTGQVIKQSHGVWHTKCYSTQNHTKSELEAICRELGFISGHAKQLNAPPHLAKPTTFAIDQFSEVKLNNNTSVIIRNTNEPLAKAFVDDSMEDCYPVYIECL